MTIKVATSKTSNLPSVAPDRRYKPEMFRFAQFATGRIRRAGHDNPIEGMSSNDAP